MPGLGPFEFLSPAWIDLYRGTVRRGTAGADLSDLQFGMYELFKHVPVRLQVGRRRDILIGYRISSGRLEFPDNPWEDATIKVVADFESAAIWANLPDEQSKAVGVLRRLAQAGKLRITGDPAATPAFIRALKLHDTMAAATAPYVAQPAWEG